MPQAYECPVYATSDRGETFIFAATLPSDAPARKWVLAGVALLTSDDD